MFRDESRLNLYHFEGRYQVWRREGERYKDDTVMERVVFGGGSIMVWGASAAPTGVAGHSTGLFHEVGEPYATKVWRIAAQTRLTTHF